jgi:hypothetical protein
MEAEFINYKTTNTDRQKRMMAMMREAECEEEGTSGR